MDLKLKPTCEILKKKSEKSGKDYYVLYFKDIEKDYFLDKTEVLLLKKIGLIKD